MKTQTSNTKTDIQNDDIEEIQEDKPDTDQEVARLKDQVLRSQADYQNLVRRQAQERQKLVALAAQDVVEQILTPLTHLEMAASQIQDAGLDMVVAEFYRGLEEIGLKVIDPLGENFDVETMEAVESQGDESEKVIQVNAKGFKLNGVVIRHAKVVVGK